MKAALETKITTYEERLSSAVDAAKRSDFEYALDVLEPISKLTDFRFQKLARIATKARDQVAKLHESSVTNAERMMATAAEAFRNDNREDVVKILKNVPEPLLDEDSRVRLAESKTFVAELKILKTELAEASQKGDWLLCGGLIDQLLTLCPLNPKYAKTAETVAVKLFSKAKKYYGAQRYSDAARHLEAIPKQTITNETRKLTQAINDVRWLFETIEAEPFLTPTVKCLAAKLARLVPEDARAKELLATLQEKQREPIRDARCRLPRSLGHNAAWTGGEAKVLSRLTRFEFDEDTEAIQSNEAMFAVAIGLCVQALGKGRITDELSGNKKGLFGRKKIRSCWGIDVGSSSFKAIRMEITGESLRITDFFFREFESNRARQPNPTATEQDETASFGSDLESTIQEFTETYDLSKETLWGNLPASEMTTRFVRLPPLPDKKALPLLDTEIASRIPLPLDDLVATKTISAFDKDNTHGRAAIFSAARKNRAERRMKLFQNLGLKLDGLQADPNAIVNFAYHEFADFFDLEGNTTSEEDGDAESPATYFDDETPTICVIDAGADATTIIFLSTETHWSWTIDQGGERLTSALARSTQSTTSQAEALKRKPSDLTSPESQFAPLEERMEQLRIRLQQIQQDAYTQNSRFKSMQTWCVGGNHQTHQWIRRVLVSQTEVTSPIKKPTGESSSRTTDE